jgi:diguanylate cyclase (GGDEF)-like protein
MTAERMRAQISEEPVNTDAGPIAVTISIGLAAERESRIELLGGEELVRSADSALYRAKANGRNRVERASEALVADSVQ